MNEIEYGKILRRTLKSKASVIMGYFQLNHERQRNELLKAVKEFSARFPGNVELAALVKKSAKDFRATDKETDQKIEEWFPILKGKPKK
jgi:hypothetical protein